MNRRTGLLHLQLGQETIYLLLAISLASALVLAIIAAQQSSRLARLETMERRDQPPIITLSEARGYYFRSGSADLSGQFRSQLRDVVVPTLAAHRRQYEVTVIEVIGHTDEQPLGGSASTLDFDLLGFLSERDLAHSADATPAANPTPADNTGLGMLRAAAVSRALRDDPRLAGMVILPLSAGQTAEANDTPAQPGGAVADRERRRIEIRMRRSNVQ